MGRISRPVQSEKAALRVLANVDTSKDFSPMSEFCGVLSTIVATYSTHAGMNTMYNRYVWGAFILNAHRKLPNGNWATSESEGESERNWSS